MISTNSKRQHLLLLPGLFLILLGQSCFAINQAPPVASSTEDSKVARSGFFDLDLNIALYRSDFDAPNEGTCNNPLRYPKAFFDENGNPYECIFSPLPGTEPCASEDFNMTWWPGNEYPDLQHPGQQGNAGRAENFWVVSLNNEVLAPGKSAFHACNPAPPNLSQALNVFGSGVMGIKIGNKDGEDFNRIFMSMNLKEQFRGQRPHRCGPFSSPFLAIGAQQNRGNGKPVAYISDAGTAKIRDLPSILRFSTENMGWTEIKLCVDDNEVPFFTCSKPGYLVFRLMILAKFPDHPGTKMMFVNLESNRLNGNHRDGPNVQWNWPVQESFYYPGADLSFFEESKYREG